MGFLLSALEQTSEALEVDPDRCESRKNRHVELKQTFTKTNMLVSSYEVALQSKYFCDTLHLDICTGNKTKILGKKSIFCSEKRCCMRNLFLCKSTAIFHKKKSCLGLEYSGEFAA